MIKMKLAACWLTWGLMLQISIWVPFLAAGNYALLIGVGKFLNPGSAGFLEGPAYDVPAMKEVLKGHGFTDITTLVDAQATKARILAELEALEYRTQEGDKVIIYYSGHGTSRHDVMAGLPLPETSGAILPYDFYKEKGESPEILMNRLIVGKRDLQPILKKLDQGRQLLVLFDACFSEYTVRNLGVPGKKRNPILLDEEIGSFEAPAPQANPQYPYSNVFYMSASSACEVAWDITSEAIQEVPTYNNEPHGAFTNALLKVLSSPGLGDRNNDNRISMEEIHLAVETIVKKHYPQTPQALPRFGPNVERLRSQNFFNLSQGGAVQAIPENTMKTRIQVVPELTALKDIFRNDQNFVVTDLRPQLRLMAEKKKDNRRRILFTFPNYSRIWESFEIAPGIIAQKVRQYAEVLSLIDLAYPCQTYHTRLSLTGNLRKSVVTANEEIGFEIESSTDVYLLLLNINPDGIINILYPFYPEELKLQKANTLLYLPKMFKVLPPFGTDVVKVFSFNTQPRELEKLVGKDNIAPGSFLFKKLWHMVGKNAYTRPDIAQDVIRLTSVSRDDIQRNE